MVFDGTQSTDATRVKIYIDTVQQSLTFYATIPSSITPNTAAMNVGYESNVGIYLFGGLNKLEIYNTAWTQSDINKDYSAFLKATNIKKPKSILKRYKTNPKPSLLSAFNFNYNQTSLYDVVSGKLTKGGPIMFTNDGINCQAANSANIFLTHSNPNLFNGLAQATFCVYAKCDSTTTCGFFGKYSSVNARLAFGAVSDTLYILCGNGGNTLATVAFTDTKNYHKFVILYDGTQSTNATKLILLIDGVQQTLSFTGTIPTTLPTVSDWNLALYNNTTSLNGTIKNFEGYNKILSTAELNDWNNRMTKITLLEDFSNNGADGVTCIPTGWSSGFPGLNVQEEQTGNKYIKKGTKYLYSTNTNPNYSFCQTPSNVAYGTWEFYINTSGAANDLFKNFIQMKPIAISGSNTGYRIDVSTTGIQINQISLYKFTSDGSAGTRIINNTQNYAYNTWHKIKITRTVAGLFTLYVNDVNVGSVTDTTYTTCNYFGQWDSIGGKIANIKITDGIIL
jgi:hypothetical protein